MPIYNPVDAAALIAIHAAIAAAHHARYTNAEAIAAAKTDPLLLNYTQGARAHNNANQSIPHNTWTALALNSERYDTDTIHDNVTNNSRLTCKTAGVYSSTGCVYFNTGAISWRGIAIRLNGTTFIGAQLFWSGAVAGFYFSVATIYKLAVNDYIELLAYQTTGGAINSLTFHHMSPEFAMQRIG